MQPLAGGDGLQFTFDHRVNSVIHRINDKQALETEIRIQGRPDVLSHEGPVRIDFDMQMPVGIAPEGVVLHGCAQGLFQRLHSLAGVEGTFDFFVPIQVTCQVNERAAGQEKHPRQQADKLEQRATGQRYA